MADDLPDLLVTIAALGAVAAGAKMPDLDDPERVRDRAEKALAEQMDMHVEPRADRHRNREP